MQLILIKGGCVTDVFSDRPEEVSYLIDYDNLDSEAADMLSYEKLKELFPYGQRMLGEEAFTTVNGEFVLAGSVPSIPPSPEAIASAIAEVKDKQMFQGIDAEAFSKLYTDIQTSLAETVKKIDNAAVLTTFEVYTPTPKPKENN